ncbi:MAG: P1 family peptidase [Acidobacteriota bacterium]|nr:P1 family peptidase [Acidobacteriota bacterium]
MKRRLTAKPVNLAVGFLLLILTAQHFANPFSYPLLLQNTSRPRAREAGVKVGVLPVGPLNSITDVAGVLVGHATIVRGENIRTGVTAILPHSGNLFRDKVAGAVFVGNGFGKLMGSTQVDELGEIETPILLTSTLSVPRVADALLDFMLGLPGNEDVQSVNPVVAETNDGYLNDIRGRHITRDDVFAALKNAKGGPVEEGSVGAGTGTVAFGFKGGIGTSSRKLPSSLGGYTVGVLVQTNYGGVLTINGAPVGQELGRYFLKEQLGTQLSQCQPRGRHLQIDLSRCKADGSVIVVIATDAPVDARNLKRMGARSMLGLGRTGAAATNGSGDYAIAFSTSAETRIKPSVNPAAANSTRNVKLLTNDAMSPLFLAVIEATEEAVYNSMFRATTVSGRGRTVEALPLERTLEILRKHGAIQN